MRGRQMKYVDSVDGNITKKEKELRTEVEESLEELGSIQPTPPARLRGEESREWKRITKEIKKLPITNIDKAILEVYCVSYALSLELEKVWKKEGTVITNSKGDRVSNPNFIAWEKATDRYLNALKTLGITPPLRLKTKIDASREKRESEQSGYALNLGDR